MFNIVTKNKDVKNEKSSILFFENKKVGLLTNIAVIMLGTYFRLLGDINYSVSLGDSGSITVPLLKGFSLTSGRSLIYLGLYGLFLTLMNKRTNLKGFYSYYMVATVVLSLGSLIYFIV